MKRKNISSGTVWEDVVGYSRAVRVGNTIEVSGTTAVNESGDVVGKDDPYAQTAFILNKIEKAIEAAGGSMKHVVRTRMFVTDISQWKEIARAHAEWFGEVKPAASMIQVADLIDPDLLIEIEATAIVDN